jgi:pyridinium-3,5-biscarboxylic acid mononucleotide sulfurtransferase
MSKTAELTSKAAEGAPAAAVEGYEALGQEGVGEEEKKGEEEEEKGQMEKVNRDDSNDKYKKLIEWFQVKNGNVLVALSGGVDSAVVALVAKNALGKKNVLAVTANYQTLSREELDTAIKVANELEIKHNIIEYNEMDNPEFKKNDSSRCFHCRNELADNLIKVASKEDFKLIVDGSNTDDLNDYRPGMVALHQKGIKSPLIETGFNKKNIRTIAEANKLSVYDKPSNACLASRISKNIEITPLRLKRIENCESMVKEIFKVKQVRVRDHGQGLARIEVEKEEMENLFDIDRLGKIELAFKENGFKYVTIDIGGYKKSGLGAPDKAGAAAAAVGISFKKDDRTNHNDKQPK